MWSLSRLESVVWKPKQRNISVHRAWRKSEGNHEGKRRDSEDRCRSHKYSRSLYRVVALLRIISRNRLGAHGLCLWLRRVRSWHSSQSTRPLPHEDRNLPSVACENVAGASPSSWKGISGASTYTWLSLAGAACKQGPAHGSWSILEQNARQAFKSCHRHKLSPQATFPDETSREWENKPRKRKTSTPEKEGIIRMPEMGSLLEESLDKTRNWYIS